MADNTKLIEHTTKALAALIDKQTSAQMPDHEKKLMGNCLVLLSGVLMDINRIANALERNMTPIYVDREGGGQK